jgi:uncharacterized protein YecT (DUF1311 family)
MRIPWIRPVAFWLVLAASTSPAGAQDCDAAEDQAMMNLCADRDYKAADAKLNAQYREITARLADDKAAREKLVKAQRSWIAFRDAECAFAASGVEGGSVYPMILGYCLAGLTQARSEDLAGYLSCEEGDLSCPVPW